MRYFDINNDITRQSACDDHTIATLRMRIAAIMITAINMLVLIFGTTALARDDYQEKVLFSPDDYTLKAEARGHIVIYDGLDSDTVDRAMDEQFKRINNMMFIRIQHEQEDGEYLAEDDGC